MGVTTSSSARSPLVKTLSGPVRGRQYTLSDGRTVDMYMGIPYAEPPIGKLRFKKPQPIKSWTEELNCVEFGPRCPQRDEYFAQKEDNCLTLNVFTPRWRYDTVGSSCFILFMNLCVKDVVVVSVNYRLGPFGFFTTGDHVCRGNMGLWDQTLALHWIHDNVASFGGDPENVTLFGQSAGGASADLLAISPHSRGWQILYVLLFYIISDLFHRLIPMAGCGECEFAMRTNKSQAKLCREFARFIGWTGDGKKISLLENKNSFGGFHSSQSGNLLFVPNFDGDFFPKPMDELRRESPRKQIMLGTTQHEGLFFGFKKFCRNIVRECDYGSDTESVQREIYDFYLKDVNPKDKKKVSERFVQLLGDYAITAGVMRYVQKMTEYGNEVYFYCFEYYNPDGFGIFRFLLPFKGATHCSEVRYILGKGVFSKFKPSNNDLKMLDMMTDFFTNFAKNGNPNVGRSCSNNKIKWEPYDVTKPYRHLLIQLPAPTMADDYQGRRAKFWEQITLRNRTKAQL
ncbi:unnamed protein product [Angiostrongylus costaricensis]|uniref:Carboxylic ester hydrolase n=1 Tax=Angiostrongylus costaricensis TaxID=334426 RepID=A0A158PH56_ANGCS|nr:unnamed protein product [Angiostrongylus costaricensis]